MQRIDILKVLHQTLAQPLAEEIGQNLAVDVCQKSDSLATIINKHGRRDACITPEDILTLIENDSAAVRTMPAYNVAWLVFLFRQSDHFQQLQTRLMSSNTPLTPIEWRIYTYVAEANELRALSPERVQELQVISTGIADPNKLQADLTIAYYHICYLIDRNEAALEKLIELADEMRENEEYRRYNLGGIHLNYLISWKNLSHIDFAGATVTACFAANLEYCNLQNTRLLGNGISFSQLQGANLCEADFTNVNAIDMNYGSFKPEADITVLGLKSLAYPLNKDEVAMLVNQFYERFCRDRLSALEYTRWAIAIELIEAINSDDSLSNREKLEMLSEFHEHPLFAANPNPAPTFVERIGFGRFFGSQQRPVINHPRLEISTAMTQISERIALRQN